VYGLVVMPDAPNYGDDANEAETEYIQENAPWANNEYLFG